MFFNKKYCKIFIVVFIVGYLIHKLKKIRSNNWKKQLSQVIPSSKETKHSITNKDKIRRFNDQCPLCPSKQILAHSFRTCAKFTALKAVTSKDMYYSYRLREADEAGFCAAAILPCCLVDDIKYILLTKEKRTTHSGEMILFNFAGGKRDCVLYQPSKLIFKKDEPDTKEENGLYTFETSKETAMSEFEEEVEPLLKKKDFHLMYREVNLKINSGNFTLVWIPKSKAVLYLVEVPSFCKTYPCIPKPDSKEAILFEWVSIADMNLNTAHEFVRPTLEYVKKLSAKPF